MNKNNKKNNSKNTVTKASKPVVNNSVPTTSAKKTRGRPQNSSSQSLVSIQDLVAALKPESSIPVSNVILRSLRALGHEIPSTPYKMGGGGVANIVNKFKPVSNSAQVLDLNSETVSA